MINLSRLNNGLLYWGASNNLVFNHKYDPQIVACCTTWEAAKAAARLLSMGEIFDGRMNVNGKLVPLTEEQDREHYKVWEKA